MKIGSVRAAGLQDVACARSSRIEARLKHHYRRLRWAVIIMMTGTLLQASMSIFPAQTDHRAVCISLGDDRPACELQQIYKFRLFVEIIAALGGTCNCLVYLGQLLYRRRYIHGRNWVKRRVPNLAPSNAVISEPSNNLSSTSLRSVLSNKPGREGPRNDGSTGRRAEDEAGVALAVKEGKPTKSVKVNTTVRLYQPRPRPVKRLWSLACLLHCLEFASVWRITGIMSKTVRYSGFIPAGVVSILSLIGVLYEKGHCNSPFFAVFSRRFTCPIGSQIALWIVVTCGAIGCFAPYMAAEAFAATQDTSNIIFWSWFACIVNYANTSLSSYCLKKRPDLTALLAAAAAACSVAAGTMEFYILDIDGAKSGKVSQFIDATPHGYLVPIMAFIGGLLTSLGAADVVAMATVSVRTTLVISGVAAVILLPAPQSESQLYYTKLEYCTRVIPLLNIGWILARPDLFFSKNLKSHMIQQLEYNERWSLTKSPLEGRKVQVTGDSSDSNHAFYSNDKRSRLQTRRQRSRSSSSRPSRSLSTPRSFTSHSSSLEQRRSPYRAKYRDSQSRWAGRTVSLPVIVYATRSSYSARGSMSLDEEDVPKIRMD